MNKQKLLRNLLAVTMGLFLFLAQAHTTMAEWNSDSAYEISSDKVSTSSTDEILTPDYFNVTEVGTRAEVQERMIYSTNFQDWETAGSTTTTNVLTKKTVQGSDLNFSLLGVSVDPSGTNTKFTSSCVTAGYMMMEKKQGNFADIDPYIEFSSLPSVTTISFVQAATGGNRGITLKVKGDGDTDWVYLHNKSVSTASGEEITYEVNRKNVVIRFENFASGQNSYLLSVEVKGNVEITAPQVKLSTAVYPLGAGMVAVNPPSAEFDENTEVTLTATANFGYEFEKWTDANDATLSTENPFVYTLAADANITAVFKVKTLYSFSLNVDGGANSYLVAVTPAGQMVDGVTYFEEGATVQVSASSNKILTFTNWNDGVTESVRTITMDKNIELTASYSACDFIVGWDFYRDEPKAARAADYASESTNAGVLSLRKADGTTNSWLAKGVLGGKYEGRYGAVNWKQFTTNDNYYYEASFSTSGYSNVKLSFAMLCNYNAFSVQKVQYSVDGNDFKDLGTVLFEAVKTWYDTEFVLPEEACGVDKLYIRWMPDYTSSLIGTVSDNDGTAITDIFVIGDKEIIDDTVAPELLTSLPAKDATGVSANGSLILTFNEKVKAGEGNCVLNGEVLSATYSGYTVVFKYSALSYNTDYTFIVPAGAIVDMSGNAFAGTEIKFTTMERIQPVARLYDAVVAADGSGDHLSVQAAITAAPENRVAPYLIFIKEGTYKEHIDIPATKPYIYLIGQDVEKVIITDDQLCGGDPAVTGKPSLHVSLGATVVVQAANFYAENISFENSWGIEKNAGPQALALYTNNDRAILNNCKLRSYQDTYLTSTKNVSDRHYLKNCFIEGAVDFIYGAGDVYFDECDIYITRKSGGYIVAPSHKADTRWGYVFMNNTITAPAPASETSVWLGRPWKDAPKTIFLNTKAAVTIPAAGWYETMGAIPAIFADYNTMNMNGDPMDLSNRISDYWYWADDNKTIKVTGTAKSSLTPEEAAAYTIKNVLAGSDSWQPALVTEAVETPVITGTNFTVSWDAVPYAICYVITKNDKVVGFTTETTYTDAQGKTTDIYTVQAANEYGGLSAVSNKYTANPTGIDMADKANIVIFGGVESVSVNGISDMAQIQVFNMSGMLVNSYVAESDFNFPLAKGSYIVRVVAKEAVKSSVVIVR